MYICVSELVANSTHGIQNFVLHFKEQNMEQIM